MMESNIFHEMGTQIEGKKSAAKEIPSKIKILLHCINFSKRNFCSFPEFVPDYFVKAKCSIRSNIFNNVYVFQFIITVFNNHLLNIIFSALVYIIHT